MKYHVTIKDNETGETHIDQDVNAVLLATNTEEDNRAMLLTHCNILGLVGLYVGAEKQLKKIENESPMAVLLAKTHEKIFGEEIVKNEENKENNKKGE